MSRMSTARPLTGGVGPNFVVVLSLPVSVSLSGEISHDSSSSGSISPSVFCM
jgi:hypothetical protein